jgi:chromatin remodeling complex protein RSC6
MATKTAKKAKKAAPAAKSSKGKAAPAAKPKAKAAAAPKAKKAAAPKAKKAAKRKPNPALMKPLQPDAVLGVVVGSKPAPRGQIVKKLWDYIKKNGLQDAKNKRNINADANLKAVFNGKKQVSMFEMTKLVSSHIK